MGHSVLLLLLSACVCEQSVHNEVDRRCRGISETLSKFLRVMRCVSLDDVVIVRQRIEHVRSKADNVVILSANRFLLSLDN